MRKEALAYVAACGIAAGLGLAVAADSQKPAFPSQVTISVQGGVRTISSNGIPNHDTGQFPGRGNPNTISPQHYDFHVPADPKPAAQTTALRMQPFGVAVNGVVFDPGANEWWNRDNTSGWQYEALGNGEHFLGLDESHAHVQPTGAYHYHGVPAALIFILGGQNKMVLVGYAADGFSIYNNIAATGGKKLKSSYRIKQGTRPSGPGGAYDGKFVADYEYVAGAGDLDECNGITSATPENPQGAYHYVLTDEFPGIPRNYRGTPDQSFARHGPPGGAGGGRQRGPGGGGQGGGPGGGEGGQSGGPGGGSGGGGGGQGGPGGGAQGGPGGGQQGGQQQGGQQGGPGGPGGRRPPTPLAIVAIDTNKDGTLSADEIAGASAALKKCDKNGDGKLTIDEYLGQRPNGPPGGGQGGQGGPGGGQAGGQQGGGPQGGGQQGSQQGGAQRRGQGGPPRGGQGGGPGGPPPGGPQGPQGENGQGPDGPPQGGPGGGGQGGGQQGGPGGGQQGGQRHPVPAFVRALDTNHDDVIDAKEIENAPASLKTLDKNNDGQLTFDEYMGPRPNPPGGQGGGQQGGPGGGQGGPPGGAQGAGQQAGPPDGPPPGAGGPPDGGNNGGGGPSSSRSRQR